MQGLPFIKWKKNKIQQRQTRWGGKSESDGNDILLFARWKIGALILVYNPNWIYALSKQTHDDDHNNDDAYEKINKNRLCAGKQTIRMPLFLIQDQQEEKNKKE